MIKDCIYGNTQYIICDNCTKLFINAKKYCYWKKDELPTKEDLENKGWEAIDSKHYCPNCKLC